jgi:hypothetical protein
MLKQMKAILFYFFESFLKKATRNNAILKLILKKYLQCKEYNVYGATYSVKSIMCTGLLSV